MITINCLPWSSRFRKHLSNYMLNSEVILQIIGCKHSPLHRTTSISRREKKNAEPTACNQTSSKIFEANQTSVAYLAVGKLYKMEWETQLSFKSGQDFVSSSSCLSEITKRAKMFVKATLIAVAIACCLSVGYAVSDSIYALIQQKIQMFVCWTDYRGADAEKHRCRATDLSTKEQSIRR